MTSEREAILTDDIKAKLKSVSTATITSQLQRRGFQNCFLNGLKALNEGQSMVGYAHTLRYVPARPDLAGILGTNAQRDAAESMAEDEVLIIEARGEAHAGTIGDIFAMRVMQRGGVGVITDGALRDTPAIKAMGMAVYHQSSNAAVLGRLHSALAHQVPIACAGATVLPGDILVGDEEGVVVIPAAMLEEITEASVKMEIVEEFAVERVAQGASTIGYFPLADENRPEFEAWLAAREAIGEGS
jgi:5-oxopent-3-ene-1,2,5-tricarboxylate decarboxylase/2-hydroxyhepta-2,4-diene-1,7-dioate isomerase